MIFKFKFIFKPCPYYGVCVPADHSHVVITPILTLSHGDVVTPPPHTHTHTQNQQVTEDTEVWVRV